MSPAPGRNGGASLDGLSRVNIGDIEAELAKRTASAAEGAAISRTRALNLIVYVGDASEAAAVARSIEPIAEAHPMRVIQLMLDPKTPETEVDAWVDLDCGEQVAGRLLCSERIALLANPESSERMVSAVNALIGADMPVALWWRAGSPFLSRVFKGLTPLVDKIVVDSIRFGDGPASLDTLHRLNGLRGGRTALADMNWHRIATWRSTLAACFDDPAILALLPRFDRSEIVFSLGPKAKTAPPSARSLLLAGWTVSRLPSIAGHGDISGANSSWATPGSILALRLRASATKAAVSIEWSQNDGIAATAIDESGTAFRKWRFSPDPEDEADLLFRCIDSLSMDPLLDAALEVG